MTPDRVSRRTLSENVFGATVWNTLLLPAKAAVSLVTSVVYYSGILSRSEVAMVFLLQGVANTLGLYVDLGIERSLPRFLPEVEQARGAGGVRRLLRRAIEVKLLVLIPVVVGLFAFSHRVMSYLAEKQAQNASAPAAQAGRDVVAALPELRLGFCFAVAGLLVAGALHDVFMQTLNAFFRRREWNTIAMVSGLLQPILLAVAVLLGTGLPGVLAALVATALFGLVLSARAANELLPRLGPPPEPPRPLAPVLPRFVRFAGLSWLIQLTGWFYDVPLLVLFAAQAMPLAQVALLGFAYKFARDFVLYVTAPLVGVLTPALVLVKTRESPGALQDAQASLTRIVWLLVLPAGVGLSFVTLHLVAALYPDYREAAPLAVVFVVFVFAEPLLSVPQTVAMVFDRYRAVLSSRALALASIPLLAWLTPRFGLTGAAVAVGIGRILPPLALVIYTARAMDLRPPLAFLARVTASSLGMAVGLAMALGRLPLPAPGSSVAARIGGALPVLGIAAGGALLFLALLRLLGGLEPEDRRRLLALNLPARNLLARLV